MTGPAHRRIVLSLDDALARICAELLDVAGAQRTTIRLDAPDLGLGVDLAAAEAVAPGTASIAHDSSIDQRSLETVRWLASNRRVLVQDRFTRPPFPPPALTGLYGVRAQILAPILGAETVWGWVSVHSAQPRHWTQRHRRQAERAAARAAACVGEARQRGRGR